ncbi:SiaB family protein kinase [Sulfurimonas sp.]
MNDSANNSKSYLEVDGSVICQFDEKIDNKNIVSSVTNIESSLKKLNISEEKIDDIFKVMIEILNNILNYSSDTKDIGNKSNEAKGTFKIVIDTKLNSFIMESSNLIYDSQKEILESRLLEVKGLDYNSLRKLKRKKMRAKYDVHDKGAGLGFLTMALIVGDSINIEFIPVEGNILKYILRLSL